jgi:hypothetical protein
MNAIHDAFEAVGRGAKSMTNHELQLSIRPLPSQSP